jgi:hypothetical protein
MHNRLSLILHALLLGNDGCQRFVLLNDIGNEKLDRLRWWRRTVDNTSRDLE